MISLKGLTEKQIARVNLLSLKDSDIIEVSRKHGLNPVDVKAVSIVESLSSGYYFYKGRWFGELKVRLEAHKFRKYTDKRYDKSHPTLSYPYTRDDKHARVGQAEFTRFLEAANLDAHAAQMASSWGMFQIMGFNHEACGFDSPADMINNFYKGEVNQLRGFIAYCDENNLLKHLRSGDYGSFFRGYNGEDWKGQGYGVKFQQAKAKFSTTFKQYDPCH